MSGVLGIDIGGTRTIVAPGDETGLLEDEHDSINTDDITSSSDPIDYLAGIIEEYDDYNFGGIGIGAAGIVDSESLEIEQSANWDGISFRELAQHLDIDENHIHLENDTDASLLGEKKFGSDIKGNIAYMNYGTGLGGNIWKDGDLDRGLEPGFLLVNHHKFKFEHGGAKNPYEAFCSGTGIEMVLEQKLKESDKARQKTSLSKDNLSAERFFEAVRDYDEFAIDTYAEIKKINTQLLCGELVNNHSVETLIFGGSVVSNNSFYIDYEYGGIPEEEPLQDPEISRDKYLEHANKKIFLEDYTLDTRQPPELRLSELGDYSVLYGAIATALQNIETEI